MLKNAISHRPCPKPARTRPFPSFVLGSKECPTYTWDRTGLGRLRVGPVIYRCASAFVSPTGLFGKGRVLARLGPEGAIDDVFEHPNVLPAKVCC